MGSEIQDAQGSESAPQLLWERQKQGSTFPIGLQKDKAFAPGGKLSLARRERWKEKAIIQNCSASAVPNQSNRTRQPLTHAKNLPFQHKK